MPANLKARLGRIRSSADTELPPVSASAQSAEAAQSGIESSWQGWTESGFKTLKRVFRADLAFPLPEVFPKALAILVPDIARAGRFPAPKDLLFFDLETTGLSSGAGTVAFLAAFGRFVESSNSNPQIEITQYLLLDYPGESNFIENVVSQFSDEAPFLVTYNGKNFDSQILKTRCLMNGIKPPQYFHADLLHPSRRLWKGQIPNCSQATIEVSVLSLSRDGDVSGALAPDIWFEFLQSGENAQLLSVCDHNALDITGLACIFLSFCIISQDPIAGGKRFNVNEDSLAVFWKETLSMYFEFFPEPEHRKTGETLLKAAAEKGFPRSSVVMAKIAEWRLKDFVKALFYTDRALTLSQLPEKLSGDLEKRRTRLLGKIACAPNPSQ